MFQNFDQVRDRTVTQHPLILGPFQRQIAYAVGNDIDYSSAAIILMEDVLERDVLPLRALDTRAYFSATRSE